MYKIGDKVEIVGGGMYFWSGDKKECYGVVVGLRDKDNPWVGLDLFLKKNNKRCNFLGGKSGDGTGWGFYDEDLNPYT